MSIVQPTYLVDKAIVAIDKTNPLPVSAIGGGGAVDQGTSNADPADGWSARLTDGSAFITPAKTEQFPTALGATTAVSSLGVGIATDQLATLATVAKQDTGNTSLATIATKQGAGLPAALVGGKLDVNLGTSSITLPISAAANLPVSQATASNLNAQVVGAAANGAAAAGNPVLMAGIDTTTARTLRTDTSGNLSVVGSGTTGAAITTRPVQVGGSDGTDLRDLATDTAGRLKAAGASNFTYIAAAGTSQIKSSAGILRGVSVTAAFSAGSLTVYNANGSDVNPIAGFGPNVTMHWPFNLVCDTGIRVVASAGFDGQITVEWD